MTAISNKLKTTDPAALAARFGAPPTRSRREAPPPGPQERADMALIGHMRAQAEASLALRDDMWAAATPVTYAPTASAPRRPFLDSLLN
ncbi:MAG: hypothetical protein FJ279_00480 [Planctomycetes bacterium]|nr:hypothetical protein [Planctomycetota bacterium]